MDPFDDGEVAVSPPEGAFSLRRLTLPVHAAEDDEAFEFTCRLPEGCGDNVAVALRGGELSIRVTRDADGAVWQRSFTLLEPVDTDGGVAVVDGDLLRIRLPKADLAPA